MVAIGVRRSRSFPLGSALEFLSGCYFYRAILFVLCGGFGYESGHVACSFCYLAILAFFGGISWLSGGFVVYFRAEAFAGNAASSMADFTIFPEKLSCFSGEWSQFSPRFFSGWEESIFMDVSVSFSRSFLFVNFVFLRKKFQLIFSGPRQLISLQISL